MTSNGFLALAVLSLVVASSLANLTQLRGIPVCSTRLPIPNNTLPSAQLALILETVSDAKNCTTEEWGVVTIIGGTTLGATTMFDQEANVELKTLLNKLSPDTSAVVRVVGVIANGTIDVLDLETCPDNTCEVWTPPPGSGEPQADLGNDVEEETGMAIPWWLILLIAFVLTAFAGACIWAAKRASDKRNMNNKEKEKYRAGENASFDKRASRLEKKVGKADAKPKSRPRDDLDNEIDNFDSIGEAADGGREIELHAV